ncbi:MAG: DUF1476 family protein [Hyphomicrobiales bacterium]|nr:DUF1476 family protein [Hyphomicrobiales bacterium]MDE2113607.1 DUF1476 domain-containing protein [Hyphomicrobiales bacterium]
MTIDDKREQAFEAGFVHEEELRFKAIARRNHKLGTWGAQMLGKTGKAGQAYAETIVALGLEADGNAKILARLSADFDANGVDKSQRRIEQTMDDMMAEAMNHMKDH